MVKKLVPHVNIAGLGVSSAARDTVLEVLGNVLVSGQHEGVKVVFTPNPEQVVQARSRVQFSAVFKQDADLAVPDGIGLVWASRWLARAGKIDRAIPERLPGVEVAEALMTRSGQAGLRVMIMGGRYGGREEDLREVVATQFGLMAEKIAYYEGPSNVARDLLRNYKIGIEEVGKYKPHLLLVAFGAPWQELWLGANKAGLDKAGVRVAMAVGGALDFWMGKVSRAPERFQRLGLEWLWRLYQEPWRWKRQLRLLKFVGLVIKQVAGKSY